MILQKNGLQHLMKDDDDQDHYAHEMTAEEVQNLMGYDENFLK